MFRWSWNSGYWQNFVVAVKSRWRHNGVNFLVSGLGSWDFSVKSGGKFALLCTWFPDTVNVCFESRYLPQELTKSSNYVSKSCGLIFFLLCLPCHLLRVLHHLERHGDVPVEFRFLRGCKPQKMQLRCTFSSQCRNSTPLASIDRQHCFRYQEEEYVCWQV